MQPLRQLENWLRQEQVENHGNLYPAGDFRSLYPGSSDGAYRALIHPAERRGLLERVCQGLYQYVGARDTSGRILFHAAALLRVRHFNYISVESALSEAGVISQVPMGWITLVSTGRTASVDCGRFGTIEFLHSARPMSAVREQLTYDAACHLFRASNELATNDMHRFHRTTIDLL